jgi:hypothetical protein
MSELVSRHAGTTPHGGWLSPETGPTPAGGTNLRDILTVLQQLPRDAEVLAFEAGCEAYREREVDKVEWQGDRVYLHLGVRHDERQHG